MGRDREEEQWCAVVKGAARFATTWHEDEKEARRRAGKRDREESSAAKGKTKEENGERSRERKRMNIQKFRTMLQRQQRKARGTR